MHDTNVKRKTRQDLLADKGAIETELSYDIIKLG